MPSEGVTRPLPVLNGAYGNANRREFERHLCRTQIQRPSVGPPAMGRFRASADRALVNGAAPASPPSASIANAGVQAPAAFSRPWVLVMFCSCLARMSSPPTPTSSSGSPVDGARERAPIASPGSLQIRLGDPDDGAPRPSRRRLRHLGCAPPRSVNRRPKLTPLVKGSDGSARPGGAGRGCAAGASAVR